MELGVGIVKNSFVKIGCQGTCIAGPEKVPFLLLLRFPEVVEFVYLTQSSTGSMSAV